MERICGKTWPSCAELHDEGLIKRGPKSGSSAKFMKCWQGRSNWHLRNETPVNTNRHALTTPSRRCGNGNEGNLARIKKHQNPWQCRALVYTNLTAHIVRPRFCKNCSSCSGGMCSATFESTPHERGFQGDDLADCRQLFDVSLFKTNHWQCETWIRWRTIKRNSRVG